MWNLRGFHTGAAMKPTGFALLLLLLGASHILADERRALLDEESVLRTIAGARQRLLDAQHPSGAWEDRSPKSQPGRTACGTTALCTYALLQAGENPNHPAIRKAVDVLAKTRMTGTYNVSLRCMVFAKLARWDRTGKHRKQLEKDTAYLIEGNLPNGQWTYGSGSRRSRSTRGDNSNSQFAVLALREAYYAGARVPRVFWKKLEKYWKSAQQNDGGWHYQHGAGQSYGSMTAAGLATAYILMDVLRSGTCCGRSAYPMADRGLAWMDRNFRPDANPGRQQQWWLYYLYGVERVGETSGVRYFGRHDWFLEGGQVLLGRFGVGLGRPPEDGPIGTAFTLIFLARGMAPVLFNKLDYGEDWNANPRDVAHVARYLSSHKFERPLNWQVLELDAPVAEWHDSPVLFVSVREFPTFSDAHASKIKAYLDTGGTIWFDAACASSDTPVGPFRVLADRLYPHLSVRLLPPEHAIFSAHFRMAKTPRVIGLSNGCRELMLFTAVDPAVSCSWQKFDYKSQPEAFELAGNVFLYATDKQFRSKLHERSTLARSTKAPGPRIPVAHLTHERAPDPCPGALQQLSEVMQARAGIGLDVREGLACDHPQLADCRAAFLTGIGELSVSDGARRGLVRFLDGGGLLVVSAAMGDEAFAASAAQLVTGLAGEPLVDVPPDDTLVSGAYGRHKGFDVSRVRFTRALRTERPSDHAPVLKGVQRDGRWAVVYTPYDLVNGLTRQAPYRCRGYELDDALRVATNIFLSAVDGADKAARGDR